MINFNKTISAMVWAERRGEYLGAYIKGELNEEKVGPEAILATATGKRVLSRHAIPAVYDLDDRANTTGKVLVFADLVGLRSAEEADVRRTMGILTAAWESRASTLPNSRRFLVRCYANWVARTLRGRFRFPQADATEVQVLCALYYHCRFVDNAQDVLDNPAMLGKLMEDVGVPVDITYFTSVLAKHDLREMEEFHTDIFINCLRNVSAELRDKMSWQTVTATLANTWFGEDGSHYAILAIEYPPAFATLMYYALVSRSYSGHPLTKLVTEYVIGRKQEMGTLYTRQMGEVIKTLLS